MLLHIGKELKIVLIMPILYILCVEFLMIHFIFCQLYYCRKDDMCQLLICSQILLGKKSVMLSIGYTIAAMVPMTVTTMATCFPFHLLTTVSLEIPAE